MNPLFEKYFLGELTDLEEEALEKMLTTSQDSAWEFSQIAEQTYIRYGLPKPRLPKGPGAGPLSGTGSWHWIGLATTIGLAAGWLYHHAQVKEPALAQAPASITTVRPSEAEPPAKAIEAQAAAPEPPVKNLGAPPQEEPDKVYGDSLKAVLHLEAAGPVTVRVVNAEDTEVRRLYAGVLQAGRWGFQWDGRAQDGNLVEPGKYRIEVEAGGVTQNREVRIK